MHIINERLTTAAAKTVEISEKLGYTYAHNNKAEVYLILRYFTILKQTEVPKELDDYLQYVAKTGDTIFKWSHLKYFFRQKLLNVIAHLNEYSPEIRNHGNVSTLDYENKKHMLLQRLDRFVAAPFSIQRLCEHLVDPHKHYSRLDRFMLALEKIFFVLSTIKPLAKLTESQMSDLSIPLELYQNGSRVDSFTNAHKRNGNTPVAASSMLKVDTNYLAGEPAKKKQKLDVKQAPVAAYRTSAADSLIQKVDIYIQTACNSLGNMSKLSFLILMFLIWLFLAYYIYK